MKKKFFISIFTLFVALVMIIILRFDDAKKLIRSLQDKGQDQALKPILVQKEEKEDAIPLKDQRESVTDRIPLDVDKIKELRESGMTLQSIADQMGVSASTISNRLRELK